MDNQTKFTPPARPLYPLAAAANAAGLTPDLLQSAIERGDLPGVRVLKLGPRNKCYVRSHHFLAWLEGVEPPAAPGADADKAAEDAVAADFSPTDYVDNLFSTN